jgi:hypothetical protein
MKPRRQRTNRQPTRQAIGALRTLAAMKNGATLHLHFQKGCAIWQLSSGPLITAKVAAIVTASHDVVALGDSLFPGHLGQTWRSL